LWPATPSLSRSFRAVGEFGDDRARAKTADSQEFASLIEIAVTPDPRVAQAHMTTLVALGYMALTTNNSVVTGDGLIRMTESE
jgi:hypothetical protein